MAGGAFASAVYGLETKLKAKTRDAPEEAQEQRSKAIAAGIGGDLPKAFGLLWTFDLPI